jgi:hypothetical protein
VTIFPDRKIRSGVSISAAKSDGTKIARIIVVTKMHVDVFI